MQECFYCHSPLVWRGDADACEYGYNGAEYEGQVVSCYLCPRCGAEYEVLNPKNNPNNEQDEPQS